VYRDEYTTRCRLSCVYRDELTESVFSISEVVMWCDFVSLDALIVFTSAPVICTTALQIGVLRMFR
jgi:hypothetical protein